MLYVYIGSQSLLAYYSRKLQAILSKAFQHLELFYCKLFDRKGLNQLAVAQLKHF